MPVKIAGIATKEVDIKYMTSKEVEAKLEWGKKNYKFKRWQQERRKTRKQ